MADVFEFELHENHTDGNYDEDSDDVSQSCYLQPCLQQITFKYSHSPFLVSFSLRLINR